MAIYQRLEGTAFAPAEWAAMASAYENTLIKLGLRDRDDPVTALLADKIIEAFRSGVHDPIALSQKVIDELGLPKSSQP